MLSRVAENLYWMARYVERAENTARVVGVNANLLLDLPKGIAPGWKPLVDVIGSNETFEERYQEYGERQVLKFLLGDADNGASILSSLQAARENCRTVRDILPRQAWELVNELHLYVSESLNFGLTKRGRHEFLRRITRGSQQLTGMLGSVLNRDEGFHFIRLGRNLERADMTTRIIDVRSADLLPGDVSDLRPFDTIQWVSVLHSLSAYQMYRRTMQVQVSRRDVLTFLLKDTLFPRAVMHCLDAVEESIGPLKHNENALKTVRRTARQLQRSNVDKLQQEALHEFIDNLQLSLIGIHDAVAKTYFLPPEPFQAQSQSA